MLRLLGLMWGENKCRGAGTLSRVKQKGTETCIGTGCPGVEVTAIAIAYAPVVLLGI